MDGELMVKPILFPYSYLTEDEKKRLLVLLPRLYVLRLFPSEVETSDSLDSFLKFILPVDNADFLRKLKKAISDDQSLVYEQTDGESLALWEEIFADEAAESAPFQLVTRIRGRFKKKNEEESRLWRKAYLLQLGIELEKQGIELLEKFSGMKKLESQFKEVLGVEGNDHLDLLEGGYESIARLWEYRDASLEKRMEAWSFFCLEKEPANMLPVVVSRNVRDKLEIFLEGMEREYDQKISLDELKETMADPALMNMDLVRDLRSKVSGLRDVFFKEMSQNTREKLKSLFQALIEKVDRKVREASSADSISSLQVSLFSIKGLSLTDVLNRFAGIPDKVSLNPEKSCMFLFVYPDT